MGGGTGQASVSISRLGNSALPTMPSQPLREEFPGGWGQDSWSSQGASAPLKAPAQQQPVAS